METGIFLLYGEMVSGMNVNSQDDWEKINKSSEQGKNLESRLRIVRDGCVFKVTFLETGESEVSIERVVDLAKATDYSVKDKSEGGYEFEIAGVGGLECVRKDGRAENRCGNKWANYSGGRSVRWTKAAQYMQATFCKARAF